MIVTRRGGELHLVSQVDHGRLAGALAASWGNDRFATPAVRDALLIAATHHDDGWAKLEPRYHEGEGRPRHFPEVSLADSVDAHRGAIDEVYERYLLAGALSGMHRAGLYSSRWGPGGSPDADPLATALVADEERRWVAAIRRSWDFVGRRSQFEAEVWFAYEVLQAIDLLALALPMLDLSLPSGTADARPMGAALTLIEQPVGPRLIDGAPTRVGGDYVDVRVWVQEPWRVLLRPYPFGPRELELEFPVRRLADRRYTEQELDAAYRDAPVETARFTLAAA